MVVSSSVMPSAKYSSLGSPEQIGEGENGERGDRSVSVSLEEAGS